MKDSVLERFKSIIAANSKNPTDFCKIIGVAQTTLSNQLQSTRGISVDVILLTLSAFPEVSAEWLLRGKGDMILSKNLPPILGDESESDLDTHAMLAQAKGEIDSLVLEIAKLKEKLLKQEGTIEWQKGFISELIAEKLELEKKLPQEKKKDII